MEERKVRAILWDIDGTLITTEPLHYEVIRDWCRDYGYELTPEANEELVGKSMAEKWDLLESRLSSNADETDFRSECARQYAARLHEKLGRSDTLAVLDRAFELGIPQGCVSNGDRDVIRANLAAIRLTEKVAFAISGEDVARGKPDPEPYLLAAHRLGIDPAQCLAVEDSAVGVASAKAAGMIVLAWPEEGEVSDVSEADYIIRDRGGFPWELFG